MQLTGAQTGAEVFVREYLALLDEGWEPELEEYIRRVPESMREEVFMRIDEALANPPSAVPAVAEESVADSLEEALPEEVVEPEPDTDFAIALALDPVEDLAPEEAAESDPGPTPVADRGDLPVRERAEPARARMPRPGRFARILGLMLPAHLREAFLGEWLQSRRERRELGLPGFEVDLLAVEELYDGIAQRAPLKAPSELEGVASDSGPRWAWIAWRWSGTMVLAGLAAHGWFFVVLGALLLLGALAGTVLYSGRTDEPARRLSNGVLGGTVVAITMGLLACVLLLPVAGIAIALEFRALTAFAFGGIAWVSSICFAWISANGRVPEPWWPRRLVRVRDAYEKRRMSFNR